MKFGYIERILKSLRVCAISPIPISPTNWKLVSFRLLIYHLLNQANVDCSPEIGVTCVLSVLFGIIK